MTNRTAGELFLWFAVGLAPMLAGQALLTVIGWRRGNTFTTSGWRVHWDNARFRDLESVLRFILACALAAFAAPKVPDAPAIIYIAGVAVGFISRSISDVPIVFMQRWGIKSAGAHVPQQSARPSVPKPEKRRGRDR